MTSLNPYSDCLFKGAKEHWTKMMMRDFYTYAELDALEDSRLDTIKKELLDQITEHDRKRREKIYSILSFQREVSRIALTKDAPTHDNNIARDPDMEREVEKETSGE